MANNGRGKSPGSRKALEENRARTQFRGESAVKGAEKSNEAQRQYKTFREGLLGKLTPEVQDLLADAMIEKALAGDTRAYELIRDTMGEKPKDSMELTGGGVKFVFGSAEDGEDLSG